ncbi:DUF6332 family protein [Streptomyces sp. NPDC005953]|uniref:DUF6332 family protein n=1 Tax=Streptomyces sp. NPDC005953 TaxID=3156719 RepID=UPI0033F61F02
MGQEPPSNHSARRTPADRDAITVEIGYALLSAAFAAAVVFGAIAAPKLLFTGPYALERGLLVLASACAALVFVARVVTVLWRFKGATRGSRRPDQPNQPGRTKPDS